MKFCSFRFIWSITSAKRTYAEVVSGVENTPDDGQSWMRAYQQESKMMDDDGFSFSIAVLPLTNNGFKENNRLAVRVKPGFKRSKTLLHLSR